jgi:hypothetical protein
MKSASNDNLNNVVQTVRLYITFCRLMRSAGVATLNGEMSAVRRYPGIPEFIDNQIEKNIR